MASDAPLRKLLSELNSAADNTDILGGHLRERARSTHSSDESEEKLDRGITLFSVCATESHADVQETSNSSPAELVEDLLRVVKSKTVFGRCAEKEKLLSQLVPRNQKIRDHQLTVIPIVGTGGIGKTTLARLVYENPTVQEHFELKAWVKIDGQERNQIFDIARKLLRSATGMLCHLSNLSELDEMVVDTLLSNRSLIVLDDVVSMETELWQKMRDSWFRFVGLGSKIVITTRDKKVAEVVSSSASFDLGELHQDDAWSLYSSLAFSSREENARMIKGVPLSLRLLGSLMRFEKTLNEGISSSSPNLMELDTDSVISMSVLALPQHLFKCFAYCGIFPCGHVLEKEKLIKMWIADDVVKPSPSPSKSLEDIGEAYFHELLCRSFFTDLTCNEHDEIVEARMPSVIHESAQQIAEVVYKDKIGYAFAVDANSLHLSIASPFQQDVYYYPRSFRTLLSFPHKNLHLSGPDQSFIKLERLRSLDLSASGIRELSKQICMLRKLRYLNLSNTHLTKLPKSFTGLTRLQTLDLSRCYYLKTLPRKMSNLSKLRHLDLSHCKSLCCMPFEIQRLNSLITMPLFVVGDKDTRCAALAELRVLNELRGVLVIRNLENVKEISEAEAANLKGKKRLHHLGLSWSQKVDECLAMVECLQPNPELRVLELTGYGPPGFPSWIPNLHCLVKLLINDCKCTTLPTLGQLPLLKELQLKELVNLTSIGHEFYGEGEGEGGVFPSLENLKLHSMPNLNNWSDHASCSRALFPQLKKLSIQGCPKLQTLPSLPHVTELVVLRSHSEILPLLTRIRSLSSIVINGMDVKESIAGMSGTSDSVRKLIVVHSMDLDVLESSHINKFASLKYLRILHCFKLQEVRFPRLGSLEKLNVVDCQELEKIDLRTEEFTLTELIVEDCPKLRTVEIYGSSLRKLIVRNCPLFSISIQKIEQLGGLEFLYLVGCVVTEEEPAVPFNDSVSE